MKRHEQERIYRAAAFGRQEHKVDVGEAATKPVKLLAVIPADAGIHFAECGRSGGR
jgi:hypothetical protein